MGLFSRDSNTPRPPAWMRIGLLAFLAFAGLNVFQAQDEPQDPLNVSQFPAVQEFISVDRWEQILDPDTGREMTYQDRRVGEGDFAACGQQVSLEVAYLGAPEKPLPEAFVMPESPITFRIGSNEVHRVFDQGVRGMRPGGERVLQAGATRIDPQANPTDDQFFAFLLTLQRIEPLAAAADAFIDLTDRQGTGRIALCGERIRIKLDSQTDPITITLGESVLGHGIDRGAIGMRVGETRQLTLPPEYRTDPEMAVVKITRLPYNPEQTHQGETQDEPDRQSLERDQTLTDDGGDSESR